MLVKILNRGLHLRAVLRAFVNISLHFNLTLSVVSCACIGKEVCFTSMAGLSLLSVLSLRDGSSSFELDDAVLLLLLNCEEFCDEFSEKCLYELSQCHQKHYESRLRFQKGQKQLM